MIVYPRHRPPLRRCRKCGCTNHQACIHPGLDITCSWAEKDLCTGCSADAVPGWIHPHVWGRTGTPTPDLIAALAV